MYKIPAHKLNKNQKGFAPVIILLIVAALAVGGYFAYQSFKGKSQPSSTTPTTITGNKKPALRSKAPGIVTQITLTKTIDPKTGSAISPANIFSKTDPTIYTVITLNNPPAGTKIEYTRYLNGKFLDNRSTATTKATDKSVIFNWSLKTPGATHLVGSYKVKIYTNGIFEKEISYTVQ